MGGSQSACGLLESKPALPSRQVDAVVGVTAPGAAPVDLAATGNPIFVVPGSMLGAPSVSLPVLEEGGLPLRLQVLGDPQADADQFAVAGWIEDALRG